MNIARLFSAPVIVVKWDDAVRQSLKPAYQGVNNAQLPVLLFDLLKDIGSVQSKRANPSLITSMMDYWHLIERLSNTNELKLKIRETRDRIGSEMLTEVSELLGIGLSVVVMRQLFDVQRSTISKIIGVSSRRPDWSCFLRNGDKLLVEAKGSTSKERSKTQLKKAIEQKNAMTGDVKVAAATLLKENAASEMKIVDPPVEGGGEMNGMLRHIYRANHYTSTFSFLGDDILSQYFDKMAKRLSGEIGEGEMNEKELMFHELAYNNPRLELFEKSFSGHLYGPVDGQYLYIAVDTRLLSYRGFMDFQDYDEDFFREEGGNQYLVHSDGIMIVNVMNAETFVERHSLESIKLNVDNIVLSDIDSIKNSTFNRYVRYLLSKCYGEAERNSNGILTVKIGRKARTFVTYHSRNINKFPTLKQEKEIYQLVHGKNAVLVTNLSVPKEYWGAPCVNRSDLQKITESGADTNVVREVFNSVL